MDLRSEIREMSIVLHTTLFYCIGSFEILIFGMEIFLRCICQGRG